MRLWIWSSPCESFAGGTKTEKSGGFPSGPPRNDEGSGRCGPGAWQVRGAACPRAFFRRWRSGMKVCGRQAVVHHELENFGGSGEGMTLVTCVAVLVVDVTDLALFPGEHE